MTISTSYPSLQPGHSTHDFRGRVSARNNSQEPPKAIENKTGDANGKQNDAITQTNSSNITNKIETELSQQELSQLKELAARDREVRAHEAAHAAVAGSLAKGGPTYRYQRGPDGQLYAVGGEVQIDTSAKAGDPEATVEKARQIRRAALAPAQPSQQDRAVAAAASAMEAQAKIEIAQEKTEDGVKTLNEKFSDKALNQGESETKVTEETAIHAKCAQCGGQHSATSHDVSISLDKTFSISDTKEQKKIMFDIAV